MFSVTSSAARMAGSRNQTGNAEHGISCKHDICILLKHDITYMVASHLQGDIALSEEGGCGLISGLDCRTCLPAPMDFAAKVLI